MRLIDADTLVKDLSYLYTKNHIPVDMRAKEILTTIMEQPTAYDLGKVVEELEALMQDLNVVEIISHIDFDSTIQSSLNSFLKSFSNKAIEIVKQGGVGKEREAEEYNGGWISVKDRLPDKAGSYLVIGKSGGATVTRWYMPSEFYPEGHFGGNSADYIRYWMPRPEPPKERD